MSKQIITAYPEVFELDANAKPIIPAWVVSGEPVTRTGKVVRSHDWTSNIVIWHCTAGSFKWHYAQDEVVIIVSGEVFITNEKGEEYRLGPGDLAFFPAGSSSLWRVPHEVRKIAVLKETMWRPLGLALKASKKLLRMAGIGGPAPL